MSRVTGRDIGLAQQMEKEGIIWDGTRNQNKKKSLPPPERRQKVTQALPKPKVQARQPISPEDKAHIKKRAAQLKAYLKATTRKMRDVQKPPSRYKTEAEIPGWDKLARRRSLRSKPGEAIKANTSISLKN